MSAPYCSVDGCHDTRTNSYARSGTTNGAGSPNGVTGWPGVCPWGELLCRIHALQKYRFAIGGAR